MNLQFENQWSDEMIPYDSNESRSFTYLIVSAFLHVSLFSLAIYVGSILPVPEIPAITEFTILDTGSTVAAPIAPSATAETRGQKSQAESESSSEMNQDVSMTTGKDVVEVIKKKQMPVKVSKAKINTPKMLTKSAKIVLKGPTVADSDVMAPILESEEFEKTLKSDIKVHSKGLDETDINEELEKVDSENALKVAALKSELDQEADSIASDQDSDLKAFHAEQVQKNKILEQKLAALKADNADRLAKAEAEEKARNQAAIAAANKAAAEKAALTRAAEAQASALAASRAAAQGKAQNSSGLNAMGTNAKGTSSGNPSGIAGVTGPVRSLQELKQMPGNKRPAYSNEDRLAGHQGDVAFLAYISKEGRISDLKMLKSTGFRSLDLETLRSIKQWRFYPGQEGWVEIPFKWDLKGGPQELPTLLRRQVSQK